MNVTPESCRVMARCDVGQKDGLRPLLTVMADAELRRDRRARLPSAGLRGAWI